MRVWHPFLQTQSGLISSSPLVWTWLPIVLPCPFLSKNQQPFSARTTPHKDSVRLCSIFCLTDSLSCHQTRTLNLAHKASLQLRQLHIQTVAAQRKNFRAENWMIFRLS